MNNFRVHQYGRRRTGVHEAAGIAEENTALGLPRALLLAGRYLGGARYRECLAENTSNRLEMLTRDETTTMRKINLTIGARERIYFIR